MQPITLRKGQRSDLAELQQLFFETVSGVCSADYDARQIKVWASSIENKTRWEDVMASQTVIVAQKDERIVGFASLHKGQYIDLFYVHKNYQRQGIARKLITEIEALAREQEQAELSSDVSKTARLFFEAVGFKVVKEQTVVRQGVAFTNYKMTKKLARQ